MFKKHLAALLAAGGDYSTPEEPIRKELDTININGETDPDKLRNLPAQAAKAEHGHH